jgi:hypothetical protein
MMGYDGTLFFMRSKKFGGKVGLASYEKCWIEISELRSAKGNAKFLDAKTVCFCAARTPAKMRPGRTRFFTNAIPG